MRTEMLGNADDRFFHADDAAVFAERPVVLLVHPERRNALSKNRNHSPRRPGSRF
jgi:hypothetical protein